MQTRSQRSELEKVKTEIENSCKKNQKEKREKVRRMANQRAQARALEEYGVSSLIGCQNCIVKLTIEANTFKIEPAYIQMVSYYQFGGLLT